MQVEVLHPAYLRSLRIGARIPRDDLVAVRTPVDLREVSPGALDTVGTAEFDPRPMPSSLARKGPVPIHGVGGVPFVPLHRFDRDNPPMPVDVPDALAYLGGGAIPPDTLDDILLAFQGTPLQDLDGAANLYGGQRAGRGEPVAEARLRGILHDGRQAAAAAVTAHLAGEAVVAGDRLLLRMRPRLHHSYAKGWVIVAGRLNPFRDECSFGYPVDRIEEAEAFELRSCPPAIRETAARLAALLPPGDDLDDVRFATACVAAQLAGLLRGGARKPEAHAARAAARDLAPIHASLRIGGMADRDLPDAIAAIRRAFGAYGLDGNGKDHRVGFGLRYLDAIALPRLAHLTRPDPEDAAAIGALAP